MAALVASQHAFPHPKEETTESLRLEVRRRTLLFDHREFVFITEDGREVEKTDTEGPVRHADRGVITLPHERGRRQLVVSR